MPQDQCGHVLGNHHRNWQDWPRWGWHSRPDHHDHWLADCLSGSDMTVSRGPCNFSFDCISLCLECIDTVRDLYVVYALSAQNAALTGILADAVRIYS